MMQEEVCEAVALRLASNAHAFSQVQDSYFKRILHPNARKNLPHRTTIVQDIKQMYEVTQVDITKMLVEHHGAFHIALDLCQVGNGDDFLGIVIFWQVAPTGKPACVELFVLECLSFEGSHTGTALANTVWGVVCNNTSNNSAMMDRFASFNLKRLTGPTLHVYCMLHILNLAAKAIALPFRKKCAQLEELQAVEESNGDDDDLLVTDLPLEDDNIDQNDDGLAGSWTLVGDGDDDQEHDDNWERILADLPNLVEGSPAALEQKKAAAVLYKLTKLAHKLRFTPLARITFQAICAAKDVPRPHSIRRDMTVRFNSTEHMMEDADCTWDGIIVFQRDTCYMPRKLLLHKEDRKVIQGLLMVLKPLKTATEVLLRASVSMLADVIVHYNTLDHCYVLHPSMHVKYLKAASWEPEWIETVVDLADTCWQENYKPEEIEANVSDPPDPSPFGYPSFLEKMYSSIGGSALASLSSPVHEFVNGEPLIDCDSSGNRKLLDPLAWWYAQHMLGNEHEGLMQMALDVLCTPATSVNVEQAFSFTGSTVSKRCHNLMPCTIQATATLSSYAKAGLVKAGCLALPHKSKKAKA
ncbi:hypothetical protein FRC06_003674 [Ceratobasidium sp. 370]|nr:hypothetical protein FRC06_003674 [Ceratobasidium sp. 370]